MATSTSTESRELELVGKVEMRIALAKDDKLESVLKLYLAPLLLKLGSEHVNVRNKVISTCQHIKIRLSGNQSVILPVAALLKQYKENPTSPMIRHFDLLFIQQSIGKLSSKDQLNLLPVLLHGLAEDSGNPTCATVFNLFLRLLPRLKLPLRGSTEDTGLRTILGLNEHVEDAKFISAWFSKLILLTIIKTTSTTTGSRILPLGLTAEDYDFLTLNGKDEAWDPKSNEGLNLTETKINVLAFLASGSFTDTERFLPALYAAADSNSRISSLGEDMLKRTTVSLEDPKLVVHLFEIYFNSKPALQTRILFLLSKSSHATSYPRKIIKLVQEGVVPRTPDAPTLKGLEALKLRNAMFQFMNWVARMGTSRDLEQVAPPIVTFLRQYIEGQGWPVPNERSSDEAALRALAYETIGSMAKSAPSAVVEPELSLVRWLFRSLTEERSSDNIFISIEGALASLLNAFAIPLNPSVQESLRLLLLQYMTQDEDDQVVRSARFATVRWANRCLEYNDVVGRWIDIIAVGGRTDERSDVIEEGNKGLDPYWYRLITAAVSSTPFPLPMWTELVKVFFTGHTLLENSNAANSMKTGMEIDGVSVFGNFPGSKIHTFSHAVSYCRRMLLLQALKGTSNSIGSDADWERQLDVLLRTDKLSRKTIKAYMAELDGEVLSIFFSAAFEGMLYNEGNGLQDCGKTFVELASLAPKASLTGLAARAEELLPAIKSNKAATRAFTAQAFGILAPHPANDAGNVIKLISFLMNVIRTWETAVGADANQVHGSIIGLGHLLSRIIFYGRPNDIDETHMESAVLLLLDILHKAKDKSNREAVFSAIGQMSAAGIVTPARIDVSPHDINEIIKLLTSEAKKGGEKAISALGRLSITLDDETEHTTDGPLSTIFKDLYGLHELRQAEIHFTIGETLACAGARWQSDSLQLGLDVDSTYVGLRKRSATLKWMMDKLLTDCKTTKPSLKKASGIWLFCLIQYCGHLEEIQTRLRECQAAFMGLLSSRDDLVQETASRGLSMVYEQGDKDLRERLVADLVASFTGTTTKIKVDEDTELFEPGALPTGDGESVTSYKDIMSLAAEVGDQSLVYKFMSLASNAATWSTRAAFGRFGLSSILSESAVDPKLYPKLYRYRFDPNPNVQRSMNDIWSALVKNPTQVIDEDFDNIMEDLLKNILGKEWRTRQASCAAIADLVQGRQFEKYEKYLTRIWDVAFKVLDDIKGSVRKAAESLCQVMTGILVRQLEQGTSSKTANAMLKEVMPFLFSTRGLESRAEEVKKFAYKTVLKLIKSGGKTLLPFIPNLVEQILGLLSTLEPEAFNFVQMNASKYNTTEDKIDEIRSQIVSHSPLMESVERCLDLLDDETMIALVPRLEDVIKTAVGMPSKVGCSGVLVSLATRHSFVFRPHADTFLKVIEKAVLDRNSTVSAAYARSAGYVARLASDQQLLRLAKYSKNLYFSAEDENKRQISADITYAVSKFATERFNSLAVDFLPFVFMAKHDFDEHAKEQFEKTWDENVGGSRAVLLYLKDIISLSSEHMDSQKWAIKHTAALTIADVVSSAGTDISLANASVIWPALEKALALKTFDGKETILTGFVRFTKSAKSFWEKEPAVAAQMKKIAIREAKRNNDIYRSHAFAALGDYASARTDLDIFDEVYSIIDPILRNLISEDKMDTTSDDKPSHNTISQDEKTTTAGLTALFKSLNPITLTPSPLTHLEPLLDILTPLLASSSTSITTKLAFYTSTSTLLTAFRKRTWPQDSSRYELAYALFEQLQLRSGAGTEAVRIARAEAAEAIILTLAAGVFGSWRKGSEAFPERMSEEIRETTGGERSLAVLALLEKAAKGLKLPSDDSSKT